LTISFGLVALADARSMGKVYSSSNLESPFYQNKPDTVGPAIPDTLMSAIPDTLKPAIADTIVVDSLSAGGKEEALEARVDYKANDSTLFDLVNKKVFLYGKAVINYKDINLQADYIEINFEKNEVYATGMPDSTGKLIGVPVFKQGDQTFKSQVMRYNFRSKKGFISKVITEDGSGYLHEKLSRRWEMILSIYPKALTRPVTLKSIPILSSGITNRR
jgi:hypothetical protein